MLEVVVIMENMTNYTMKPLEKEYRNFMHSFLAIYFMGEIFIGELCSSLYHLTHLLNEEVSNTMNLVTNGNI